MERHEDTTPETEDHSERFSRRGLITGAMLGAAALLVVSCRGGDDDDDGDD